MTQLLVNMGRWKKPAQFKIQRNRWRIWSQILSGRYTYNAQRVSSAAMRFLMPQAIMTSALDQRWIRPIQQFANKINLIIHPLLSVKTREVRPKFNTAITPKSTSSTMQETYLSAEINPASPLSAIPDHYNITQQYVGSSNLYNRLQQYYLQPVGEKYLMREMKHNHEEQPSALLTSQAFQGQIMSSPIMKGVFARMRVLKGEEQNILQPLVTTQQQKAYQSPATMIVRRMLTQGDGSVENGHIKSENNLSVQEASISQPKALPTVNVDQITEQVMRQLDYRIRSYNERLGKTF